MRFEEFSMKVKETILPNLVLNNPKEGVSKIISITKNESICYKRKKSIIRINIKYIFEAYEHFKSCICTSNDLKNFNLKVFSGKGHSCNCTFFFMVLKRLSLCGDILGKGVRNSPFYVEIF